MSNPLYKIVHLGTPDAQTGLTQIAEGFREIFENGADIVFVQSLEITEYFVVTRRILKFLRQPDTLAPDYQYSYDPSLNDKFKQRVLDVFGLSANPDHCEIKESVDLACLTESDLESYLCIFERLASTILASDFRLHFLDHFHRRSQEPFIHTHLPFTAFAALRGLTFKPEELALGAELLFIASEDPEKTTVFPTNLERLVETEEYQNGKRHFDRSELGDIFDQLGMVAAPQDAIIIHRNSEGRPNPFHGIPATDANHKRSTLVLEIVPKF